jgi:hypothetical protein
MAINYDRKVNSLAFSEADRMVKALKRKKKKKQTRNELKNRKIRRSRTSYVQKLATAIWVWAVCFAADKSPDEVERECWSAIRYRGDKHLSPGRQAQAEFKATHCFSHWINLKHAKKIARTSKIDMLRITEELYPGTRYWRECHLWWAIETDPITAEQIEDALCKLDPSVTDFLFEPLKHDSGWSDAKRQRKPFTEELAEQLLKLESFDAFVASYLFVRLAYTISSVELLKLALSAHYAFYPKVAHLPQIAPYHRILFRTLSNHLAYWKFPTIDHREDHGIFWDSIPREFFEPLGGFPSKEELSEIDKKFDKLIDGKSV